MPCGLAMNAGRREGDCGNLMIGCEGTYHTLLSEMLQYLFECFRVLVVFNLLYLGENRGGFSTGDRTHRLWVCGHGVLCTVRHLLGRSNMDQYLSWAEMSEYSGDRQVQ